jgi:sugar phosphate isomerase/epimerase
MTLWPIGFSTGCFYHRRIFDVLPEICESGFREIEVCSFPAHLDYHNEADVRRAGALIHELGLHPLSFHAPFADRIDITSLDARVRERAVEELLRACDVAKMLGCFHVVLHPGPERAGRPPDHEFVQHMHLAAESLNRVADHCCKLKVHLLLENMLPHLLFGRLSDTLHLLGEIKTCEVGACLDTGHAHLAGELGVAIPKLSGHLKMLHASDNCGDRDAHLPPGEGTIDWHFVVTELLRCAFRGTLVLELFAPAHEPPDTVLARAVKARASLETLFWDVQQ